jgi:eukaryotic translation initiation factor 2C
MPPKSAPRGQSPARGRGRGGPQPRSSPLGGGGLTTSSHITTIGVKRPSFGTAGRPMKIYTNHFPCQIPEAVIHHYDGEPLDFIVREFC